MYINPFTPVPAEDPAEDPANAANAANAANTADAEDAKEARAGFQTTRHVALENQSNFRP